MDQLSPHIGLEQTNMDQKATSIVIVIILLFGLVFAGLSRLQTLDLTPTPSASPQANLFDQQQQQGATGLSQVGTNQGKLAQQATQIANEEKNPPQPLKQKQYPRFPGLLAVSEITHKKAVIQTNKGTIEFEIFPDSPKAASNFVFLTKDHFYDSLTFHRVEKGFVIQGGDPKGTGTGGPGYKFEDEPVTRKYEKGIVAMANSGPNTNGSQFFIMLADNLSLPKNYTIFGKVIAGQSVVEQIQVGDMMQQVVIVDYTPLPSPSPSASPSESPSASTSPSPSPSGGP